MQTYYGNARSIPGTQKIYFVISYCFTTIKIKIYSNLTEYKVESILLNPLELDLALLVPMVFLCEKQMKYWYIM